MKYYKYLITVCKPQKKEYVSTSELKQVLAHLHYNGIECIYGKWERHGMYKQLHYHGIVTIPSSTIYSKYTRVLGFRVHFSRIKKNTDMIVMKYIDKHYNPIDNTQHDTYLANYFKHHFLFSED